MAAKGKTAAKPASRAARGKAPAKRAGAGATKKKGVTIRMYRQGLGDCFLLGFPKKDGGRFHVMIDCGVIQGAENATELMKKAVADIIETTDGFVDVLVVTHEHFDHVSGFVQAEEKFCTATEPEDRKNKLSVGEVWTAWTEDPGNDLANKLRRERAARVKKLKSFAALQIGDPHADHASKAIGMGVSHVLDFFDEGFGAAGGQGRTGKAMDIAKSLGRKGLRFLNPGDTALRDDELDGVRVYVLGPPKDETLIKRMMRTNEVYHVGAAADAAQLSAAAGSAFGFFAAAEGMPVPPDAANAEEAAAHERERARLELWTERAQPFDRSERIPLEAMRSAATPGVQYLSERYLGPNEAWRSIDGAWTEAAAEFALQLDSYTNNTSLVLAFEIGTAKQPEERKVLLFAADAQVGNWQSWHTVTFKGDGNARVSGEDLLRRTTFYKVGHHGSHNATLKAQGLELMRQDDFAAFLSVNQKQAKDKGWGRMPLPAIEAALTERSKGRLVRMDRDFEPGESKESREFAKQLTTTALYVELALPA